LTTQVKYYSAKSRLTNKNKQKKDGHGIFLQRLATKRPTIRSQEVDSLKISNNVRMLFLEDHKNASQELAANNPDRGPVMLASLTFGTVAQVRLLLLSVLPMPKFGRVLHLVTLLNRFANSYTELMFYDKGESRAVRSPL
jgi:hypothetical protein